MEEKFKNILKVHGIYEDDVEEVLYAVQDMFETLINETMEKEPYAVNSIDRLETAAHEVFELYTYLED